MPKKIADLSPAIRYRFSGNGLGIPGLPHEISAAEAEARGLLEVLQAAVQNGVYKSIPTIAAAPSADEKE